MARNTNAGKSKAKSPSGKWYANNKAGRAKKDAYNKEFNKKPEQVAKRVEHAVRLSQPRTRTCHTPRTGAS